MRRTYELFIFFILIKQGNPDTLNLKSDSGITCYRRMNSKTNHNYRSKTIYIFISYNLGQDYGVHKLTFFIFNYKMTCKGICYRYKVKKPSLPLTRYGVGQKRCNPCGVFIDFGWKQLPLLWTDAQKYTQGKGFKKKISA